MKERPILFSAPMVLALLAGTKTQTRRIMKPQPVQNAFGPPDGAYDIPCHCDSYPPSAMLWPDENGGMLNADAGHPWFGVDRLWVKETCAAYERPENGDDGVVYSADGLFRIIENTEAAGLAWHKLFTIYGKRGAKAPSIFMPRWASRITLEITDVRAERLNKISENDARAEGGPAILGYIDEQKRKHGWMSYREWYQSLWESINGPGSWEANPWVWVVSFRRVEP